MQRSKDVILAGVMSLLASAAAILLPSLHGKYWDIYLENYNWTYDFVWLDDITIETNLILFRILLGAAVCLLIAGVLVIWRPNLLTLTADGLICAGSLGVSGMLFLDQGAIYSELSVCFNMYDIWFSYGYWIVAVCTGIALICCLRGVLSRSEAASAGPEKGEQT